MSLSVAFIVCNGGVTLSLVMSRAPKVLEHIISLKDDCLLAPPLEMIRGARPAKRVIIFYLAFLLTASLKTRCFCLTVSGVMLRLAWGEALLCSFCSFRKQNDTWKKVSVNPLIRHYSRPCQRWGIIYYSSWIRVNMPVFCAFIVLIKFVISLGQSRLLCSDMRCCSLSFLAG